MNKKIFEKAPLVEVVFEIKFKDPNIKNYEILIGELNSKLKKKYPVFESLKPQEMPSLLLPYIVQHRFRKEANGYPLYQVGPGIVTFNADGGSYANGGWASFKKDLLYFLSVYQEALSDELYISSNFEKVTLRYIDKIEDSRMYPDIKNYFHDNLKLSIEPEFINQTGYKDNLKDISLFQSYLLEDGVSKILFNIRTITEGSRKLLFDSSVSNSDLKDVGSLKNWLQLSHEKLEELFFGITSNIQDLFSE